MTSCQRRPLLRDAQQTDARFPRRPPYQLEEEVGKGSFGTVYRARARGGPETVAVKVVELDAPAEELQAVQAEIEALKSAAACPRLVRYLG